MRILCNNHGKQLGILVSPDLFEKTMTDEVLHLASVKVITFVDSGVKLFSMLISEDFNNKNNIPKDGVIILDGDYPEWYAEPKGICENCIKEALERSDLTELSKTLMSDV